eukprot:GDKI01003233.1.p1 GENE.GDKI01003233.1~~GDKI01003233.1.p1  ORF type:complete len:146 (+),score=21.89 GDKI01003233.1:90-527(+)
MLHELCHLARQKKTSTHREKTDKTSQEGPGENRQKSPSRLPRTNTPTTSDSQTKLKNHAPFMHTNHCQWHFGAAAASHQYAKHLEAHTIHNHHRHTWLPLGHAERIVCNLLVNMSAVVGFVVVGPAQCTNDLAFWVSLTQLQKNV